MSKKAKVRVCASCEWVFRGDCDCPKCGFASYGARYVYGNIAYSYEKTQEPWLNKKLADFAVTLHEEIQESRHASKSQKNNQGIPQA